MPLDFSELRAVRADIKTSTGRVGAKVATVVRRSASAIERGAKGRAPVLTGELKGDIVETTVTGDGRFASMSAEIRSTSDHAAYVEEGTSEMAPEPYLGPAFDAELPNFERGIVEAGGKIL